MHDLDPLAKYIPRRPNPDAELLTSELSQGIDGLGHDICCCCSLSVATNSWAYPYEALKTEG